MTNPISTTNQKGAAISTRKAPSETTGQWVDRHTKNVESEWSEGAFELTDELCTCWTDAQSNAHCTCTTRNSGETDAQFWVRHAVDYTNDMVSNPPAP